jgi:hypothetical protein
MPLILANPAPWLGYFCYLYQKKCKFRQVFVLFECLVANEKDLAEFITLQKTRANSENSWTLSIAARDQKTIDLSAKNPNTPEEAPLREPNEILENMAKLDKESKLFLLSLSKKV